MGRRKRRVQRGNLGEIVLLFLAKIAWLLVCGIAKMLSVVGLALAWFVLRPFMFVANVVMIEFLLLPLRIWRAFCWLWGVIVYVFDDVSISNDACAEGVQSVHRKRVVKKVVPARNATGGYVLPPPPSVIEVQRNKSDVDDAANMQDAEALGCLLEDKLCCFGVKGRVTAIHPGPVITQFEYRPDAETKISKILSLEDDLAMALTAMSVRILAPIPGKNAVGFEIAHQRPRSVFFDELLNTSEWRKTKAVLPLVLGADGVGKPVVEDLSRMPHLLVAGSTGSGKSVCMHSMISSLVMSHKPSKLKLVLIDPKRLEFSQYADIPHLLFPIVTHVELAGKVLKWVSGEMEKRYELLSRTGVRNITEYHDKMPSDETLKDMPFIVVLIDELADLMMVGGRDIEGHLVRIAQMARAAGIYLVIATQRPSVDVVTGLIKVNFPSRVAFRVSSRIDSRTILDASGAEKLLGRGDMLFMHPSVSYLRRIHGSFISGEQVERLVEYLRAAGTPDYVDLSELDSGSQLSVDSELDVLYDDALEFVSLREEVSISVLQRQLKIGFNRSARLIDQLERSGVVASAQGSKPRKVL